MKIQIFLILLVSSIGFSQQSWTPFTNLPENFDGSRYDDVFFLTENLGWAANGYNATINKTTDGGLTWTEQYNNYTENTEYYFRNIEFLDANIGFVGTLNGVFLKTINGGTTWTQVNLPSQPPAICGLDCVGSSTVYGCGAYYSPAYVIKSIDSGVTWQFIDMGSYAQSLVEVLFIDENIGYVSGNNSLGAIILKTTNGGSTWTNIYQGTIPGEYVWKLQILSSNPNYMFGSIESIDPILGKLIKSNDGGLTFVTKPFPDVDAQAVGFISPLKGWMGGHHTGFYETIDGGDSWTSINVGNNLNRIQFIGNTAYASGASIYKMSNNLTSSQFPEKSRTDLTIRVLENPVKNKLEIEIDFLNNDHLLIDLYDVNGKLVKQLKNDTILSAKTCKYSFDFQYPSGLYFLNFHNNTGRQSVKIVK